MPASVPFQCGHLKLLVTNVGGGTGRDYSSLASWRVWPLLFLLSICRIPRVPMLPVFTWSAWFLWDLAGRQWVLLRIGMRLSLPWWCFKWRGPFSKTSIWGAWVENREAKSLAPLSPTPQGLPRNPDGDPQRDTSRTDLPSGRKWSWL